MFIKLYRKFKFMKKYINSEFSLNKKGVTKINKSNIKFYILLEHWVPVVVKNELITITIILL